MRTYRIILLVTAFLVITGILMVYSSSSIYSKEKFGNPYYFFFRHLTWVFLGVLFFFLGYQVKWEIWRKYNKFFLFLSLSLLLLTLSPLGWEAGGARRWLRVGKVTLQPSELVKLGVILWLSDFLSRKWKELKSFKEGLFPPLLVLSLLLFILLLQPDLGTCFLIGLVSFSLFFVGGASLRHLLFLSLSSLPALYLLIVKVGYRKSRIIAFINPWKDPQGAGFQIIQSLVALGSGGLIGKGLGEGRQKLFYLPSAHNDFIFSIIGEELGFIGGVLIVIAFLILVICGLRVAWKSQELFPSYLALGITLLIGLQAFINLGVSVGLLPPKGITLPFISVGGTSMVVNLTMAGLLTQIARRG